MPLAELAYAIEVEDARSAEDFLLRRTKLHLLLDQAGRDAVADWFADQRLKADLVGYAQNRYIQPKVETREAVINA